MSAHMDEIAEVAARAVHDYLGGYYCHGEPLPQVTSLVDVIEVALFEKGVPLARHRTLPESGSRP